MPVDVLSPETPAYADTKARVRTARIVATVSGLLGMLLALAVPFLPVRQEAATVSWPQGTDLTNVEAPLVSYAPLELRASVPCSAHRSRRVEVNVLVSEAIGYGVSGRAGTRR